MFPLFLEARERAIYRRDAPAGIVSRVHRVFEDFTVDSSLFSRGPSRPSPFGKRVSRDGVFERFRGPAAGFKRMLGGDASDSVAKVELSLLEAAGVKEVGHRISGVVFCRDELKLWIRGIVSFICSFFFETTGGIALIIAPKTWGSFP